MATATKKPDEADVKADTQRSQTSATAVSAEAGEAGCIDLFKPPAEPYETPPNMRDILRGLNQSIRLTEDALRLLQSGAKPGTDVHGAYGQLIEVNGKIGDGVRNLAGHQALALAKAREVAES